MINSFSVNQSMAFVWSFYTKWIWKYIATDFTQNYCYIETRIFQVFWKYESVFRSMLEYTGILRIIAPYKTLVAIAWEGCWN